MVHISHDPHFHASHTTQLTFSTGNFPHIISSRNRAGFLQTPAGRDGSLASFHRVADSVSKPSESEREHICIGNVPATCRAGAVYRFCRLPFKNETRSSLPVGLGAAAIGPRQTAETIERRITQPGRAEIGRRQGIWRLLRTNCGDWVGLILSYRCFRIELF